PLANDFRAREAVPADKGWRLGEITETQPDAILFVQVHPRCHARPPIEKPEVRPSLAVGHQVDALSIPVVARSWRGIKSHHHVAVVPHERHTETLRALRVVDPDAEPASVAGRVKVTQNN